MTQDGVITSSTHTTAGRQVTLGCRMLHYTGHGSPSCLIFENENGEANLLVRATTDKAPLLRVVVFLLSNVQCVGCMT